MICESLRPLIATACSTATTPKLVATSSPTVCSTGPDGASEATRGCCRATCRSQAPHRPGRRAPHRPQRGRRPAPCRAGTHDDGRHQRAHLGPTHVPRFRPITRRSLWSALSMGSSVRAPWSRRPSTGSIRRSWYTPGRSYLIVLATFDLGHRPQSPRKVERSRTVRTLRDQWSPVRRKTRKDGFIRGGLSHVGPSALRWTETAYGSSR